MNPEYVNMSSKANYTLIFKASKIPALGFRTFFVQKMMSRREQSQALLQQAKPVKVALAQTDASTALPPLRLETDVSRLKVVELQLPPRETLSFMFQYCSMCCSCSMHTPDICRKSPTKTRTSLQAFHKFSCITMPSQVLIYIYIVLQYGT